MKEANNTIRIEAISSREGVTEAARDLLREYGEFVLAATGPARFCAARLGEEIVAPSEYYASHGGEFLLAFVGTEAAGCAGFRSLDSVPERACELKRMWVRPQFRGASLGRRLAEEVFERAITRGYEAIYLDTEPEAMPAALRLYQRLGFEECAPYASDTVGGIRYFRRSLL